MNEGCSEFADPETLKLEDENTFLKD